MTKERDRRASGKPDRSDKLGIRPPFLPVRLEEDEKRARAETLALTFTSK
jgi:hypothetical protein